VATLEGHTGEVNDCAVAGHFVISASSDKTLRAWDVRTYKCFALMKGHKQWVTACAMTSDGSTAVSVPVSGSMRVWNMESGRTIRKVALQSPVFSNVSGCAVTPDDSTIVTVSCGKSVRLWKSFFLENSRRVRK